MLNIHPEAVHTPVEIRAGNEVFPLGHLDDTLHIEDVRVARAALRTALDAGWFVVERETQFTFISYYDSVESWEVYRAERGSKGVVPPELRARALALLPPGAEGELRTPRTIYAARLRRG